MHRVFIFKTNLYSIFVSFSQLNALLYILGVLLIFCHIWNTALTLVDYHIKKQITLTKLNNICNIITFSLLSTIVNHGTPQIDPGQRFVPAWNTTQHTRTRLIKTHHSSLYIFEICWFHSKNKDSFIDRTENLDHSGRNFNQIPFHSLSKCQKSSKYLTCTVINT